MEWELKKALRDGYCAHCGGKIERFEMAYGFGIGRAGTKLHTRCFQAFTEAGGENLSKKEIETKGRTIMIVNESETKSGDDGHQNGHQAPQTAIASALAETLMLAMSQACDENKVRAIVKECAGETLAPEAVKEMIDAAMKSAPRREVNVVHLDGSKKEVTGAVHPKFDRLIKWASLRVPIAMVGPTGSGKTYAARQLAEALGLLERYYALSVGPQTTQSQIMGYMDATGKYIATAFTTAFEMGGVILLDEMDAASPHVLTCLNAATSNSHMTLPDGRTVAKHEEFVVICAMNTWGKGATRAYVGRQQLDEATRKRFIYVTWDYDADLERAMCADEAWLNACWKYRAAIETLQVRHVISPRQIKIGAMMISAEGIKPNTPAWDEIEAEVLWEGLDGETVKKIKLNAH